MPKETTAPAEPTTPIHVTLRRELDIGKTHCPIGYEIAVVQLAPDVTLALLSDSIRNGFAGKAIPAAAGKASPTPPDEKKK